MRRIFVCLLLLVAGCRAQGPATEAVPADLQQKIVRQVRATFSYPPYVDIAVGARKPSHEFAGFDEVTVTASYKGQSSVKTMLLSKDNKTLVAATKMDLTRDPQAEMMAKIDLTGRPVRGNKLAKVTMVVYDDFQCPYCSRMHQSITEVLKTYGDRVRVIYKDYPLFEIHPWAERAALDSDCLARQSEGAYWDFADLVHGNPQQIRGDKRPLEGQLAELDRMAVEIGKKHSADEGALRKCIDTQATRDEIGASVKEAETLGVEATPAVIIDGVKLDGALPIEELKLILDRELKNLGAAQ
ncbi:MAG: thioredoxin domain-containing protein [Acidobacteriota bacterium]|nr:thioredoxin domain-containing protein [Acidobacteriota bacterium]